MNENPIKPYLRQNMERRIHGQDNLCSAIQDIYLGSTDEKIRLWCRIAMRMAKNMEIELTDIKRKLEEKDKRPIQLKKMEKKKLIRKTI